MGLKVRGWVEHFRLGAGVCVVMYDMIEFDVKEKNNLEKQPFNGF